ncbi:hypothetical protein RKJ46_29825 [Klebsiella pneumoniae]|nr:hypothetical protein [Klebsiella pneumoniae]
MNELKKKRDPTRSTCRSLPVSVLRTTGCHPDNLWYERLTQNLNDYIRGNLGLAGTGETFTLLDRVDSTQAERRDSRYFSKGQIIIPEQDYKNGMKRGESYQVLDTGRATN